MWTFKKCPCFHITTPKLEELLPNSGNRICWPQVAPTAFQLRNRWHGERTFLSLARDFPWLWYSCIEYDWSVCWRAGQRIFQFARWFLPDLPWVTFQTSNTKQHFNLEANETKHSLFWREVLFQQHVDESLIVHRYNVYISKQKQPH